MSDFHPDEYLRSLPRISQEIPDDDLIYLIAECDEKFESHEANYAYCQELIARWREAYNRWERGERKTQPYPKYGGVNIKHMNEQYATWTKYWKRKKEILLNEQQRRRMNQSL